MLRCVLRDVSGQSIIVPQLLNLQVNIDENVPADSLYAVMAYMPTDELVGVTLYQDDEQVFTGIMDEQEHVSDETGEYLKISARSPAAHLLDNEAMPCAYDHPSLSLIYDRYVKPFGITMTDHGDAVYFGELNILKGSSCWRAVKQFCNACFSSVPRVSSTGVLYPEGIVNDREIVFGRDGVRYTAMRESQKRCEEISAVYVKASGSGSYTLPVRNEDAEARGVRRVRYLNAMLTESPMRCADTMIANSAKKAYAIELRCPSCLLGKEGSRATLKDTASGRKSDLYISAVHYRMTKDGAYSDVTLKRRQKNVDQ
ncbi:MAG: hypothetical protein IJH07_00970 [Ruminococcus sp.]|nr:hypothetical protein [Ruminococcus sp.]